MKRLWKERKAAVQFSSSIVSAGFESQMTIYKET